MQFKLMKHHNKYRLPKKNKLYLKTTETNKLEIYVVILKSYTVLKKNSSPKYIIYMTKMQ